MYVTTKCMFTDQILSQLAQQAVSVTLIIITNS